jgi:hypothetical protein
MLCDEKDLASCRERKHRDLAALAALGEEFDARPA